MRKDKFLQFQLKLIGTNYEKSMTENFIKDLNFYREQKKWIYEEMFGDVVEILHDTEDHTMVLGGCIYGYTSKGCKGIYAEFKAIAKSMFWGYGCKRTKDIIVLEGTEIF